jgi:hypothetical protein
MGIRARTVKAVLPGMLLGILAAQTPPNPLQFVNVMPEFTAVALHSDGQTAWATADNGLIYRQSRLCHRSAKWLYVHDDPRSCHLFGRTYRRQDRIVEHWR